MTNISALGSPAPLLPEPHAERYRLTVPRTPHVPKIARDFLASLLGADHPTLVDSGRLCMSEVVTNAVQHTRSPRLGVEVSISSDQVVVYVHDNKPCPLPVPERWHPELEHGRGLALVAAVADRWGATVFGGLAPESKTVWFMLAARGRGVS